MQVEGCCSWTSENQSSPVESDTDYWSSCEDSAAVFAQLPSSTFHGQGRGQLGLHKSHLKRSVSFFFFHSTSCVLFLDLQVFMNPLFQNKWTDSWPSDVSDWCVNSFASLVFPRGELCDNWVRIVMTCVIDLECKWAHGAASDQQTVQQIWIMCRNRGIVSVVWEMASWFWMSS